MALGDAKSRRGLPTSLLFGRCRNRLPQQPEFGV